MIKLEILTPEEIAFVMPRLADEQNARYFYESAAAWCHANGYTNAGKYFDEQSKEEGEHYQKWVKWLSDWNVNIQFPTIEKPITSFGSLLEILEQQYIMEWNLLEAYEKDAINVFTVCQKLFKMIQLFVEVQDNSVIESNDLCTKAYRYLGTDPELVLFNENVFN